VPHGAPLVVAGDFNDWGERLEESMRTTGLSRAMLPGAKRSAIADTFADSPVLSLLQPAVAAE